MEQKEFEALRDLLESNGHTMQLRNLPRGYVFKYSYPDAQRSETEAAGLQLTNRAENNLVGAAGGTLRARFWSGGFDAEFKSVEDRSKFLKMFEQMARVVLPERKSVAGNQPKNNQPSQGPKL